MQHWTPVNAKVLLLTDTRQLSDANHDHKNKPLPGQQAVLRNWPYGTEVWGYTGWQTDIARVSLFEFGMTVKAPEREKARQELASYLSLHKFQYIIVLQSRSKSARKIWTDDYAQASHSGSVCWEFFNPPGSLPDMQGTFWETQYGTVLPLQNPQNVDYVYGAMILRWLLAIRESRTIFLPPEDTTFTEPGDGMRHGLDRLHFAALQGKPLAIDIESYSTGDLITVLGISDGEYTCSVPWEDFTPHGQSYIEHGLSLQPEGQLVRRILASAKSVILHNGIRFDIPYLSRKNVQLGTNVHVFDTYLAHGDLYGQFRHGLQQTVSYEFVIPPWKTFHTASVEALGLDREEAEAWIQDPQELRKYNASDTFYTWHLGQLLAQHGGIKL